MIPQNRSNWILTPAELILILVSIFVVGVLFLSLAIKKDSPTCEKRFHNVHEKVLQAQTKYQEGR
jgi:hypothetical protein